MPGNLIDHPGTRDGSGVYGGLVRAAAQEPVHFCNTTDAAADGQWNKDFLRGPPDDVERGLPVTR
ncbi:hypothetical protein BJQ89_00609 [Arthrobacter sp. ES1]|nr:hypothetical protein [Arthrobacter sp. ES1]